MSRQASDLIRQMATQDVARVTTRSRASKLAPLVLLAEQFGFAYGETRRSGDTNGTIEVVLYRDPSPEAQQRAAATMAQFPRAGNGGDLPGMEPGGTCKPLPDAAPTSK